MGGYNGGEIASHIATEAAKNYILDNFNKINHEDKEEMQKLIRNAMECANTAVNEKAHKVKELEQMRYYFRNMFNI